MSDSRLRVLERRWRETNRREDQVAHLREAVRSGHLAGERLLLAALLGSDAAGCAVNEMEEEILAVRERMHDRRASRVPTGLRLGNTNQRPPGDEDDLVNTFVECGWETCVRAGLAISRRAVEKWEQQFLGLGAEIELETWDPAGQEQACDFEAPRLLWESVRLWLTRGGEARGVQVRLAGVKQAHQHLLARLPGPVAHREEITSCLARLRIVLVAGALAAHSEGLSEGQVEALSKSVVTSLLGVGATALGQGQSESGPHLEVNPSTGAESMFLSLEEELVPWLLGQCDSVSPLPRAGSQP